MTATGYQPKHMGEAAPQQAKVAKTVASLKNALKARQDQDLPRSTRAEWALYVARYAQELLDLMEL